MDRSNNKKRGLIMFSLEELKLSNVSNILLLTFYSRSDNLPCV